MLKDWGDIDETSYEVIRCDGAGALMVIAFWIFVACFVSIALLIGYLTGNPQIGFMAAISVTLLALALYGMSQEKK